MPHGLMQMVGEQCPVRQAGERITVCQVGELLSRAMLSGDITGEGDDCGFPIEFRAFEAQFEVE